MSERRIEDRIEKRTLPVPLVRSEAIGVGLPEPPSADPSAHASADIRRYLEILAKRGSWLFGAFLLVAGAILLGGFLSERVYHSYVEVQVEPEENVLPYQQVATANTASPDYIRTQTRILGGGVMARRVAEVLARPEADGEEQLVVPSFATDGSEEGLQRLSLRLLAAIEAEPVLNTQMIRIHAFAGDAERAAILAKAWAAEYIQYNAHARRDSTVAAVGFLREELGAVKERVEASDRESVRFARENPHVLLADEGRNLLLDRVASLNQRMAVIENEMDANYLESAGASGGIPQADKPPAIVHLETEQIILERETAQLRERFGPKWPALQDAQSALDKVETQLASERGRVLAISDRRVSATRERLRKVVADIAAEEASLSLRNADVVAYRVLQRESETEQRVYEGLLQRLREAAVETSLRSNNVRIITHARVFQSPHFPNIPLTVAIALSLGLATGILASFVAESLDNRLRGVEDAEGLLGVPTLGVVPLLASASQRLKARSEDKSVQRANLPGGEPPPVETEFYRSIRSSLLFAATSGVPGVVMVTSALPGEGKSATALNLAAGLAQAGESTLLIEADLHRPSLSQRFDLLEEEGLGAVLAGERRLADVVVELAGPNLFFLGGGAAGRDAGELVTRRTFQKVIEAARAEYDHVVLDTAPQLITGEAAVIAPLVDGVVLVVESSKSPRSAVLRASSQLTAAHAKLIGVLMNKTRRDRFGSGGYSYYGAYNGYYKMEGKS